MHVVCSWRKTLKAHACSSKSFTPKSYAGGGILTVPASSVESTPHSRTLTASHARTTQTRNETEADFPIGILADSFPPIYDIGVTLGPIYPVLDNTACCALAVRCGSLQEEVPQGSLLQRSGL